MRWKNLLSWNLMIVKSAKEGCGERTLGRFKELDWSWSNLWVLKGVGFGKVETQKRKSRLYTLEVTGISEMTKA